MLYPLPILPLVPDDDVRHLPEVAWILLILFSFVVRARAEEQRRRAAEQQRLRGEGEQQQDG